MEMLFGLPAHPLLVHFPVVAIPAFSIAALLWTLRPWQNKNAGLGVAVFGIVTAISAILAASSGEALAETLQSGDTIDRHRELGETLRLIVILQAVAFIGAVAPASNKSFGAKHPITLFARIVALVTSCLLYTSPSPRD